MAMKKNKVTVYAMLLLLLLSAAGCLFSFVYVSLENLSRQNRLRKFHELAGEEKTYRALEKECQDWQNVPARLREWQKKYFISRDEFDTFRRNLESVLTANRLKPNRITYAYGIALRGIKKVTVNLSLEGSYRELKKFVYDLENNRKMYFFEHINLSHGAAAVNGTLILEAYLVE
jgi:Tfp pilus assembly protein PilO